jgi:anti-sigma regulatory factor (Ser/Thr protein kinase)/predicted transcriptional regulator
MVDKLQILNLAQKKGTIKSREIAEEFNISRQYASRLLSDLVGSGKLVRIGATTQAMYAKPEYAVKHTEILPLKITRSFKNKNLEEHQVLDKIEADFPIILRQKENIRSILNYAFSEMLNNAIEHSQSQRISVEVCVKEGNLIFIIDDYGVGVFKNIMKKKRLKSEVEAIQDLLKGKTTTMPTSHSGQGIFFTSKAADEFILDSYGYRLVVVNNKVRDIFLQEIKGRGKAKRGTKVVFKIAINSPRHLIKVFEAFSNIDEESNFGFDKTEIKVRLFSRGGVNVSRSQARRVLVGLDKFRMVVFDFDKVPMIGQAFADEIFRVFHNKYPYIKLEAINMSEAVKFMIDRVEGKNPRIQDVFLGPDKK